MAGLDEPWLEIFSAQTVNYAVQLKICQEVQLNQFAQPLTCPSVCGPSALFVERLQAIIDESMDLFATLIRKLGRPLRVCRELGVSMAEDRWILRRLRPYGGHCLSSPSPAALCRQQLSNAAQ